MDRLINWIVYNDLINYANFFLASFIGSTGGILYDLAEGNCEKDKLPYIYLAHGIMGGFVGMIFTQFTDIKAVTYGISGFVGGVGLEKALYFFKSLKNLKITNEGDKNDNNRRTNSND